MKYGLLVDIYKQLESTTKRLEKTFIISEFLKQVKEEDLEITILLLQGRVFPEWDDKKIGVASRLVLKAINKATGISAKDIEKLWAKIGDLGFVAENLIKEKKQVALFQKELTLKKVYENIKKLAELEGIGSVDKKIGYIAELLTSAKPLDARYIVRTVLEELRVGTATGTLRDSIVWSYFPKINHILIECPHCVKIVPKTSMTECIRCKHQFEKIHFDSVATSSDNYFKTSQEFIKAFENNNLNPNEIYTIAQDERIAYNYMVNLVQEAYDMSNDFGLVAKKAKLGKINEISLQVGIPIKVMLGPKEADAKSALERVGIPAQAEFKYDGFRIQAHKINNKITLFTRNLENVTKQFPEIVEYIKSNVNGENFILDSEAVGFSSQTNEYLPFQSISQRIRRKYYIEKMSKEFPVELNIFDCIYYEGKSLIKEPFEKRRKVLEKIVKQIPKKIVLSHSKIVNNEEEVNKFYKESLSKGNEGLMLKKLDAPYKPGARVGHMVKMKEAEEPLDLVITEAAWGEGKRANWLSSFTLACLDENSLLVEIGKVGTGIKEKIEIKKSSSDDKEGSVSKDVTFEQLTNLLKPLIITEKGKSVKVKPKIIIEVIFEEIQKSNNYSSGYALRFPRVIRLREDRGIDDIPTINEIEDLYFKQKKRG